MIQPRSAEERLIARLRADYLRAAWDAGAVCPVSGAFGRVYHWTFYGTLARALLALYVRGGTVSWVTSRELFDDGHANLTKSLGRLDKWGLTEVAEGSRADGGKHGERRVLLDGELFLRGDLAVPHKIHVLHNNVVRRDEPLVTIYDVLGERFDLREHLRRRVVRVSGEFTQT